MRENKRRIAWWSKNADGQIAEHSWCASFSFQELDYEGAVRFYFEDGDQELTKAVKVSNETKVVDLLPVLLSKFNLLQESYQYTLYVVHDVGEFLPAVT